MSDQQQPISSVLSSTLSKTASIIQPADSELTRWRKTFDKFATEEVEGKK